jgi:hypothetical protein
MLPPAWFPFCHPETKPPTLLWSRKFKATPDWSPPFTITRAECIMKQNGNTAVVTDMGLTGVSIFARKALDQVARNRAIIVVPGWCKIFWWIDRASPTLAAFLPRRSSQAHIRFLPEGWGMKRKTEMPPNNYVRELAESEKHKRELESKIGQPFEYDEKLQSLSLRQQEIVKALDITKNQASSDLDSANPSERESVSVAVDQTPETRRGVSVVFSHCGVIWKPFPILGPFLFIGCACLPFSASFAQPFTPLPPS